MIKRNRMTTLGKRILYPILLMVLFQIFIFWLFVFQLGLFDSVINQSRNIFINNALANTRQIDVEMWEKFSDLSFFSNAYSALRMGYSHSKEDGKPFSLKQNMVNALALDSTKLNIDGIYLEIFPEGEQKERLHFRFPTQDLLTI